MQRIATFLFLGGFLFLLSVITGLLPFGQPPMLIGQAIQAGAIDTVGSANIVTAVVLGYRGIDTLGELSILFAAATAGSLVLGRARIKQAKQEESASFIFKTASQLLFPLLIVTGLYIVLHGHLTPGGGFQGGVILATAFFLPVLARPSETLGHLSLSLVEGFSGAVFIVIGLLGLLDNGAFLQPLLGKGIVGELVSAGTLPILYLAVGLKVGAELAGLLSVLNLDEDDAAVGTAGRGE
jgi:multicomponent Na+:H+ antiporter subunit B